MRDEVERRAAEIRAQVNRSRTASSLQEQRDHFATGTAESAEDLRRDLLQGDGDGDVLNVSTNRLEKKHAERVNELMRDRPEPPRAEEGHRPTR